MIVVLILDFLLHLPLHLFNHHILLYNFILSLLQNMIFLFLYFINFLGFIQNRLILYFVFRSHFFHFAMWHLDFKLQFLSLVELVAVFFFVDGEQLLLGLEFLLFFLKLEVFGGHFLLHFLQITFKLLILFLENFIFILNFFSLLFLRLKLIFLNLNFLVKLRNLSCVLINHLIHGFLLGRKLESVSRLGLELLVETADLRLQVLYLGFQSRILIL